jgi:hypothetical protein
VPVTALSVGADGEARVQVQRAGGRAEYVKVAPGLAAKGLVEVRPVQGELSAGDLVIVGEKNLPGGSGATGSSVGGGSTLPGAPGESQGSGGSGGGTSGGTTGSSGQGAGSGANGTTGSGGTGGSGSTGGSSAAGTTGSGNGP